jgi:hypothetical protein
MRAILYIFLLMFCITGTAQTQQDDTQTPPPPANIIGLKMAFVTKQLALTNEEAQKFWPVYYSYSAELRRIRQNRKEDILATEEEMLNIRKKYRTEFKKILTTDERVNKALTVDRDFMAVVKKELQQRRLRGKGKQE